jgi:hypothetical protein
MYFKENFTRLLFLSWVKLTCDRHTFFLHRSRVYILVQKRHLFPTPLLNKFFPLATCRFSTPISWPFCLILHYFAYILPFYFPFSLFLSHFFLFLSPSSFFTFSLFFSSPYHIPPPQMTSADIPPRGDGDIFQFSLT